MKKTSIPVFEKVMYPREQSYRAYIERLDYLKHPWHFHPDIELVLITKGYGKRFIGDNIDSFKEGDLIFLGSNLPHVWLNDPVFKNNPKLVSESVVIQFNQAYFHPEHFDFPELNYLKKLFKELQFGLKISGKNNRDNIISLIYILLSKKGVSRFSTILQLWEEIYKNENLEPLASEGYIDSLHIPKKERLTRVFKYVMENYNQQISMDEVAQVARMNKSAFCRYFKLQTGKTFSMFLNDFRVGYASKLLIDGSLSISQICFESGFQSISNFNKQFKIHTGLAPMQFQQDYTEL